MVAHGHKRGVRSRALRFRLAPVAVVAPGGEHRIGAFAPRRRAPADGTAEHIVGCGDRLARNGTVYRVREDRQALRDRAPCAVEAIEHENVARGLTALPDRRAFERPTVEIRTFPGDL